MIQIPAWHICLDGREKTETTPPPPALHEGCFLHYKPWLSTICLNDSSCPLPSGLSSGDPDSGKLACTLGLGPMAPRASPGPALTTGAVTTWELVCPSACDGRPVKTQGEFVVLGTGAQGSGQTNELGLAWGIVRGSRSAGASQEGKVGWRWCQVRYQWWIGE